MPQTDAESLVGYLVLRQACTVQTNNSNLSVLCNVVWLSEYTVRRHKVNDVLYITLDVMGYKCIFCWLYHEHIVFAIFFSFIIRFSKAVKFVTTKHYLPIVAGVTMQACRCGVYCEVCIAYRALTAVLVNTMSRISCTTGKVNRVWYTSRSGLKNRLSSNKGEIRT